MSDLNLNAQLGGRLKALQIFWNQDTASETLATVFDIIINRWGVTCPNFTSEALDKGLRVSLRARHVAYFTNMAQLAGCTVPDIARSMLIQWLCAAESALLLPQATVSPHKTAQLPPKATKKQPKLLPAAKKTPRKAKSAPPEPETASTVVEPTPAEVAPPKFDAKASLLSLKRG